MPKLIQRRARAQNPRRRKNARRRARAPKFVVVRGSKRNPVVMAFESGEGKAKKLAKWFAHHSGNRTVRVERFRPKEN